MKRIYLDHNATTPVHREVLEEMLPFFCEHYGNPSSIHWFGQQAKRAIDRARQQVADLIGAQPAEIVFTSGGTESDNLAIRGVLEQSSPTKQHIMTTTVEHPAVLNPCKTLAQKNTPVTFLKVDQFGICEPETVLKAIIDQTVLLSIMLANNDTGTLQPLKTIIESLPSRDFLVHCDAVQAVGKIPVNVEELGVDLLSLSSHKLYGPKGCGALYVRKGLTITPLLFGGEHERGRRAGTENVAAIVGFGKACEIAKQEGPLNSEAMAQLCDRLQKGIKKNIPHVSINGHPRQRLPNTLNVSFDGIEGESLLMNLDLQGIAVSTGSACSSGTVDPSHVLTAMGIDKQQARSSIRFSLGRDNSAQEIEHAVEILTDITQRLRSQNA